MRPVLFHIDGLVFHAYTTMLALAFLFCTLITVRSAERRDPPLDLSPTVGIWALIGALIGARVFYILQYQRVADLWQIVYLLGPGLVFYGGLIGGVAGVSAYLRLRKVPYLPALDVMAPQLALGEAITRLGCFMNGCCYGRATAFPLAVHYPRGSLAFEHQVQHGLLPSDAAASLAVHPAPLYMVAGLCVVFAVLRWRLRSGRFPGEIAAGYLCLYGLVRFTVEVLRGDSARSVLGMTVSQAISAALIVSGAVVLAAAWTRPCHSPNSE